MPDSDGQPQRRPRIGLRAPIPAKNAAAPSGCSRIVNQQPRSDAQVPHEPTQPDVQQQQSVPIQIDSQGLDLHDVFESPQRRQQPAPMEPAAAAAADSGGRKRMRVDGVGSNPDEDKIDDMLISGLSTVPTTVLNDLRKALSRCHTVILETARQIAAMEERQRNNEPPHGWRLPVFHMPEGTEQQVAAAKDKITAAYVDTYKDLIEGRQAHADATAQQIDSILDDNLERQMIQAQRMMESNPRRYARITLAEVRSIVEGQLNYEQAKAEMEADKKAAKSYAAKAKSAEAVKLRADEKAAAARIAAQPATVADLTAALEKQLAEHLKTMKDAEREHKKALTQNATGKNQKKKPVQQTKGKPTKKNKDRRNDGSNSSKDRNKGRNNPSTSTTGKRQHTTSAVLNHTPPSRPHKWHNTRKSYKRASKQQKHSATQSVTASTVVNLSKIPIDTDTESIMGLGPVFRPTPAPATDSIVLSAVRQFSKTIRTSAYFALNPPSEAREYNPRLYHPTGTAVDPDSPALDNELMRYESTISKALQHTRTVQCTNNLTYPERSTLKKMREEAQDGTGKLVYLCADKDTAFVAVSPQQHETMWQSHTSTDAYQETDFFQVDWEHFRREAVRLAKEALKSKLISESEYRFVTKDCTGDIRHPVGNLLVKTHKLINLYAAHPVPVCPTRVYIDTVNYVTTAWAKYLSVQLTAARQKIEGRVFDTADLINKLAGKRFSQDCWIVTADVVDFYPNAHVSRGDDVIRNHIPNQLVQLCLNVAKLIHESIRVLTPVGCFAMDQGYGIGLGHSGEICDLDWAAVEQRVFAELALALLFPAFWGRLVDDYLLILDGPIEGRLKIIQALKDADPKRPLKVQISSESVDFLDVTIYKGSQFYSSGILDTKPYTKPSYTGMHLPYLSHHPQTTFQSILSGYHNRSVIGSSSRANHLHCMLEKQQSFSARGYPFKLLKQWLLQETVWKESVFQRERKKKLKKEKAAKQARIVALKLQYTPRSEMLNRWLSVSTLQKSIQKTSPALSRDTLGKLTFCHKKIKEPIGLSQTKRTLNAS